MKKSIFVLLALCMISAAPVNSQGLLKKVANSMKDELLGTKKSNTDPEPACACKDAEQVVALGGKYQIDYKESDICTMDDGSMLIKERTSGNYYVVRDGAVSGPYTAGDPRINGFCESLDDSGGAPDFASRYKSYISKSGDKYLINFKGKQYGPFARIDNFVLSLSRETFAALAVRNVVATEAEGKKMEAAIKNAKTDQERMELAMQYTQQMQQKIMDGGGVSSITTELVTNAPGAMSSMQNYMGGQLSGNTKYDDIVIRAYDKVIDLTGKVIMTMSPEKLAGPNMYINSSNTRYASYNYGTLTLSDGTTYTDLFNVHLVKTGGQVFLVYAYYSPKKNAIMQCRIPW